MIVSGNVTSRQRRISWVIAGLLLIGLLFSSIFAASKAFADSSIDVNTNLTKQGWYISDTASKEFSKLDDAKSTLDKTVKELRGNRSTSIAIIDQTVYPTECRGKSVGDCAAALRQLITNPKYDTMIVVDLTRSGTGQQRGEIGLDAQGLSTADELQLVNSVGNTFTTKGPSEGARQLALDTDKRLDDIAKQRQDEQGRGTLFTILGVVVFLLIVAGLVAFLVFQTRKNWQREMVALSDESRQINDLIVKLADDVDYLPAPRGESIKMDFSQSTRDMSTANADLRELEKVGALPLIFGWGKWKSKRDETKAKFENTRRSLTQVDREVQEVNRLP